MVNVGVTCDVTTMDMVVEIAPYPGFGVKVYTVVPGVDVLIVAGFHVPVILLVEVTGSAGGVAF